MAKTPLFFRPATVFVVSRTWAISFHTLDRFQAASIPGRSRSDSRLSNDTSYSYHTTDISTLRYK